MKEHHLKPICTHVLTASRKQKSISPLQCMMIGIVATLKLALIDLMSMMNVKWSEISHRCAAPILLNQFISIIEFNYCFTYEMAQLSTIFTS